MRCVVTGGAGFIGSNIVGELLRLGHDVCVVDSLATGNARNLEQVKRRITFVNGDVRDLSGLREAFRGAEVVFHQAALASVPMSVEDPLLFNDVDATGTLNVLVAARDAGARRVVYASSSSVYGATRHIRMHEGLAPNPMVPYAVAKLAGEHYCRAFTASYGLETVSLRYLNVFGPRQVARSNYGGVIPMFIVQMLRGQRPTIFGDGRQSRDFIHVANAVHANMLAMTTREGVGKAFNVGSGKRYDLLQLMAALNRALGTRVEPLFGPPRAGDMRHLVGDTRYAKALLGYQPVMSFEDGLADTVAWFREHLDWYEN